MKTVSARRAARYGAALLTMTMLAACGNSAVGGGGGGDGDDDGPLRIGLVGPMSGPSAAFGKEFPIGAGYAEEWIKEKDLLQGREIEITVIDDQSKPDAAVAAVRELADDGVNIFVGTINSPVALALAPVMEQTDSILITIAAHAMELTHENYSDHVFRATDNPYMRHRAQAELAAEVLPDAKKWSLVGPDHSYGVSTLRSFKAGLNENYPTAVEVGPAIMTAFGAADYRQPMSAVQAQDPDAVFSSEYAADAITAYSQAAEMGLWDDATLMDSSNGLFVARALKGETPEHWTADHWYPGAYDNEMTEFITERYSEQFDGQEATGFIGTSFTGILMVAEAVKKAEGSTSTADLIPAMEGLVFETPNGEMEIRAEDHQGIKDLNFWLIRGCADCDLGYEVLDQRVIPGADYIEPATPGEPVDYGPDTDL